MLHAGRIAASLVHAAQLRAQAAAPTASRAISLSHLGRLCQRAAASQAAHGSGFAGSGHQPGDTQPGGGADQDTIAAIVTGAASCS